ncbi:MAG: DUF4197 domain-containing protein [Armatimonadota bacterium]|nr:DUF4197 domain-containing protein [Armatimonadota bacterium]
MLKRMMMVGVVVALNASTMAAMASNAKYDGQAGRTTLVQFGGLSNNKIADGLKQALQIGTVNTVNITGRLNGYFGNQAIKILMPKQLQPVEQVMRTFGQGKQVDDFVLSMNRAAERAAPSAGRIFVNAIRNMSFNDARGILTGGNTAATQYFRQKTTNELTTAFGPIVAQSMNQVGVTRRYNSLVGKYQNLPFARNFNVDLNGYVVGKAMDGLFHVLGDEERKIRQNPAAQVTNLLKQVFKH